MIKSVFVSHPELFLHFAYLKARNTTPSQGAFFKNLLNRRQTNIYKAFKGAVSQPHRELPTAGTPSTLPAPGDLVV